MLDLMDMQECKLKNHFEIQTTYANSRIERTVTLSPSPPPLLLLPTKVVRRGQEARLPSVEAPLPALAIARKKQLSAVWSDNLRVF